MKKKALYLAIGLIAASINQMAVAQTTNNIDEVVWMVGDEPIYRSDVESFKMMLQSEGRTLEGKPECYIPEQMAVQKLFLNQANVDSVHVDDAMINRYIDSYLNNAIRQLGSKEKLEEYFGKRYAEIREDQRKEAKSTEIVRQMQEKIVEHIKVSPSEIRAYFNSLPQDSLPFIPTTVELQIVSVKPQLTFQETDQIKNRLREFSEEVNGGKRDFSTIARLYSEDKRTALQGGEYGFVSKASLESEFARVAFALQDNKKVSPIVKTDDGYHIIQLIEKRGDLINFRHILLKPRVSMAAISAATSKLDSLQEKILSGTMTFEEVVAQYSEDEGTKNNDGLMVNNKDRMSDFYSSSRFKLEELPQDISRALSGMEVGGISKAFTLINDRGFEEILLLKYKNKIEGHRANMNNDFQTIKQMALEKKKNQSIEAWIKRKQKETYVKIDEKYQDCDFKYPGWVRKNH